MTPQSVRDAIRIGRITAQPDGTYDLEGIVRQLAGDRKVIKTSDPDYDAAVQPGQSPDQTPRVSYVAARTAREMLDVKRKQLDLEVQRGKLMDKAKVIATVEELASEFRDHWLQFSSRVGGPIAAELGLDPGMVSRVLDRYVIEHARALPNTTFADRVRR